MHWLWRVPRLLPGARSPGAIHCAITDVEVGHMQQEEPSLVVFRVRFGREQFTCKGHLVREGGIVYAIVDEMPDDCPFPPDQVRLEESDLELKYDESGGVYYQHHGFIFVY